MKRVSVILLFLVLQFGLYAQVSERAFDYIFFENSLMTGSYYFSSAAYTGESYVKNIGGKLSVNRDYFFTPPNSLELIYDNGDGTWEASIQYEQLRGNDFFKESEYLSLWLHVGDTPEMLLPNISIGILKKARKSDSIISDKRSRALAIQAYRSGVVKRDWELFRIPLKDFGFEGGKANQVVFTGNDLKGSARIYVDQVELTADDITDNEEILKDVKARGYERHVDLSWAPLCESEVKYIKIYRSTDNEEFIPVGVQHPWFSRYADFTGEAGETYYYKISLLDYAYNESPASKVVMASTRQLNDEELLDMVQEASFRYYWEGAEAYSGMALENVPGRKNMVATGASGFGIMAILAGAERGFITREQAVERMLKITGFLEGCDKFHGAVSHFIDGPTGKVEPFFGERDNGGDLVETSFLFQGLLAARSYFDADDRDERQIRKSITKLWHGVEWSWYDREKENKFLTWHWSPDKEWVIDHKLIGWNETMITYLLAMASPTYPIDISMYYNGWASRQEQAVKYRSAWGRSDEGSMYANGNYFYGIQLDVGVGNGGPLFFTQYSFMGFDPHMLNDAYTNYFENNQKIARINWRYCVENPGGFKGYGPSFWGLTASDGPWGYSAVEPKIDLDRGTIAPTGALASFAYLPEQAMDALKNMYRNHGEYLWGPYGFRDAVNLEENWAARIYMGLNQAPVVVMIENFRTGLIWDLFMNNEDIQLMLRRLEAEHN